MSLFSAHLLSLSQEAQHSSSLNTALRNTDLQMMPEILILLAVEYMFRLERYSMLVEHYLK